MAGRQTFIGYAKGHSLVTYRNPAVSHEVEAGFLIGLVSALLQQLSLVAEHVALPDRHFRMVAANNRRIHKIHAGARPMVGQLARHDESPVRHSRWRTGHPSRHVNRAHAEATAAVR